jgi:PRC-barrel domain
MSRRILMATVAAIALAVPAAAQDQNQPLETQEETTQQLEQAEDTLQKQGDEGAEPTAEGQPAAQPPVTAEEEPAEQPPVTAEEEPAGEAVEEELAEEEQVPPADMEFIEVQDAAQFLADEEVIGKDVVNINDEEVGTITDLVMDQDQKLVGVVLSVGGFLGIADKWVAIPVDQIDFPTDEQPARLLVAVTEEQLKNAPDFMTREEVEAEEAAAQAQQQAVQGQAPAPAATTQ